VVIVGSSLLTAAYFLRVFEQVYLGQDEDPAVAAAREAGPGVVGPISSSARVRSCSGSSTSRS
jgi:hypothetical protein